MKWLNKIYEILDEHFSEENWLDKIIEDCKKNEDNFKEKIEKLEENLQKKIFLFLNFSILEGEYANYHEKFQETLESIIAKVGSLGSTFIRLDNESQIFTKIFQDSYFLHAFKKAIEYYLEDGKYIQLLINSPSNNIIFSFREALNIDSTFEDQHTELEKTLLSLLELNLKITQFGFSLRGVRQKDPFTELTIIIEEIQQSIRNLSIDLDDFTEIAKTLEEICIFYKRKLIIRKLQKENSYREKYIYKTKIFDFTLDQHKLQKNTIFEEWDTYTQNHFFSEKNHQSAITLKSDAEALIRNNQSKIYDYKQLHQYIKYYKDLNENLDRLIKIDSFFDKEYQENEGDFDRYAKAISKNYLNNNILSLRLYRNNGSIDDTTSSMVDKINSFQEDTNISNFFPYFSLCKYLKKFIENNINKPDSDIDETIKRFKIYLEKFKINLKWSNRHLFYAFQPQFEDCKKNKKIGDFDVEIFIVSSFNIPINYSEYRNYVNDFQQFITNIEYEYKGLKNIHSLTKELEEKEKNIQEEIEKSKTKNIELLGIFSAIIALLFQGVSTAQSEEKFEFKFLTFTMMFVMLSSFLLMLRRYVREKDDMTSLILWFFVYLVVFLVVIGVLRIVIS